MTLLFLRRFRTKQNISIPERTAAAPSPAPSPAARPVLLDPPPEDPGGALDVAEAAAALTVLDDLEFVPDPDVVAAAWLLVSVVVPSVTSGLAVNGEVVLVIPGQLVLPITVMVDGCSPPNLTAFFPVSQLQLSSPGQQYLGFYCQYIKYR